MLLRTTHGAPFRYPGTQVSTWKCQVSIPRILYTYQSRAKLRVLTSVPGAAAPCSAHDGPGPSLSPRPANHPNYQGISQILPVSLIGTNPRVRRGPSG